MYVRGSYLNVSLTLLNTRSFSAYTALIHLLKRKKAISSPPATALLTVMEVCLVSFLNFDPGDGAILTIKEAVLVVIAWSRA